MCGLEDRVVYVTLSGWEGLRSTKLIIYNYFIAQFVCGTLILGQYI